jgi:hypothetical protein
VNQGFHGSQAVKRASAPLTGFPDAAEKLLTQGKVNRKQVKSLNLVCQHEFGIDISNG